LKNIGKALAKRADITPKFSTQGNGFKFSGGRLVDPHADGKIFGIPEGKMARVKERP
jgi:hypothetical protein